MDKLKVLFICKDSAIRSPLAAAFLNTYFGGRYEACCAGLEPLGLNPDAAKAAEAIGVEISSCNLKKIEELRGNKFDCVVTLCDYAKAHLPALPGYKKQLHHSFKEFCLPILCEYAKKSKMCFPDQKKASRRLPADIQELGRDNLSALRHLMEAIFYWVENEAVF